MIEKKTQNLKIASYFNIPNHSSDKKDPICASDFTTGDICIFLQISNLGSRNSCYMEPGSILTRYSPHGYIKPCKNCIVHLLDEK